MTGSGTQADPYIVTTWGELVDAAKVGGTKYIEFPEEPGTINIKEEFGNEEPPCLTLQDDTYINGNGLTIQGLWAKNHSCMTASNSRRSTIKNLFFSSFHCKADYFRDDSGILNFENCIFSGICEKNFMCGVSYSASYDGSWNGHFSKFTANIQFLSLNGSVFLKTSGGYHYGYGYSTFEMSDCNIKLKSPNVINLCDCNYNNLNIHDCLFDIEADALNIFTGDTARKTISSCIFTGESQSGITIDGISSDVVNIFNKDGFPNAVESNNFKGVTEEQLSNTQHSSDLGFPIGV